MRIRSDVTVGPVNALRSQPPPCHLAHRRPTPPRLPAVLSLISSLSPSSLPPASHRAACARCVIIQSTRYADTESPQIRQQIQVQANDAQQEHINLKRRAVDAEQRSDATRRPRKRRKRGDRARDADDSEVNAQTTELRVREAGRHFAIRKAIFLLDDDVMNTQEDDDFDIDQEFASADNERQGQLRDILAFLPDDVQPKIEQPWVQDSVRHRF